MQQKGDGALKSDRKAGHSLVAEYKGDGALKPDKYAGHNLVVEHFIGVSQREKMLRHRFVP